MAGNTLQWTFRLLDRISQPAKTISGSLGSFGEKLKTITRNLHDLDHVMGAVQKAKQLFNWLGGKVGHALDATAFKQNSLIALTAMMGSRDAAKAMFEWVQGFAGKTGIKVEEVLGSVREFLTAGFKTADVKVLAQAVSDLSVIDPSKAEAFTFALSQTQRLGFATQRSMLALRASGLQLAPVFEHLARLYHTNVEGLKKLLGEGKVSSSALTFAATKQLQQQFSGGRLGSLTAQRASTLPGVVERLKMLPGLFLEAVVGLEGKASARLAGGLERILKFLDPSGPAGRKLIAGLRETLGKLGDYLERIDTGKLLDFLQGAIYALQAFGKGLAIEIEFLQALSKGLGWAAFQVYHLFFEVIPDAVTRVGKWATGLWDAGVALVDGLVGGIRSRVLAAVDAVKDVGEAVVGGLKSLLGIHSPSAVFEGLGRFSAAGFQKGLAQGMVEGPTVRVAGAATAGVKRAASGRGAAVGPFTFNIYVEPGTPEDIAKRLAELTAHQVASTFEQLAIEMGAA